MSIGVRLLAPSLLWAASAVASDDDAITLDESLGQRWRNECVRFESTPAMANHVKAHHALVDSEGRSIPYQMVLNAEGATTTVAFAADLDPFEKQEYHFSSNTRVSTTTDLVIHEQPGTVILSNSLVGISLIRKLRSGEGPIEGIRLTDGRWIGGSRLQSTQPVTDFHVEVTEYGPVFSEAVCRMNLGGGHSWVIRFRLQAHEPVVLIDETFSSEDDSTFLLNLSSDFAPDRLFYRAGNNVVGQNETWPLDGNKPAAKGCLARGRMARPIRVSQRHKPV